MNRSFKYRLYPRANQIKKLNYLLNITRNVYNAALEQRTCAYKETNSNVTYAAQCKHFGDLRRIDSYGLGVLNCACMQQTLRRLDKAYRAFFRRIKSGEKAGFPRFKSDSRWNSLEFTYNNGCRLVFENDNRAMLYIQNVGEIKIKYHRDIPSGAKIRHVVVKRKLDKWYVYFQIEFLDTEIIEHTGEQIGIDIGLRSLLALSNGTLIDNPRWLRSSIAELRVKQRRASRRKKGSSGRRKAAYQVAKMYAHITNQRRDFWHKTTRKLTNTYSLIAIEDLTLSFMTHNHHLALSAHDASLGLFRQLLTYKVEETGTSLVAVNPAYTSQMCSRCGEIVKKDLSVRIHSCPYCNLTLDRDVNAAINILKLARTEPLEHNVSNGVMRVPRSLLS